MQLEVKVFHVEDTRRTHRYEALEPNPVIDTIYIKKTAFADGKAPENITITVSE